MRLSRTAACCDAHALEPHLFDQRLFRKPVRRRSCGVFGGDCDFLLRGERGEEGFGLVELLWRDGDFLSLAGSEERGGEFGLGFLELLFVDGDLLAATCGEQAGFGVFCFVCVVEFGFGFFQLLF